MDLTHDTFLKCQKLSDATLADIAKKYIAPGEVRENDAYWYEAYSDDALAFGLKAVFTKIFAEGPDAFEDIDTMFDALNFPPVIIET